MKRGVKNSGFTLIEIIIAVAITSIVALAASRFLASVVGQYIKDNKDVKLQVEVEEILNLLENFIMDADDVIVLDESGNEISSGGTTGVKLRVNKNEKNGTGYVENYYLIFLEDGNIYESQYQKTEDGWVNAGSHEKIFIGTHVGRIGFTLTENKTAVFVDVCMEYAGASYDASRKILLRNQTKDYKEQETSSSYEPLPDTPEESEQPSSEEASSEAEKETEPVTTTPVSSEEPDIDDNINVIVTNTSMERDGDYYKVSFTILNQGVALNWEDIDLKYFYNSSERYNIGTDKLKLNTNNPNPDHIWCSMGSPCKLDGIYENATGFLPLELGTYYYKTFDSGKSITISFTIWNYSNNIWDPIHHGEYHEWFPYDPQYPYDPQIPDFRPGEMPYYNNDLLNSYSALDPSHVLIYHKNQLVFGNEPQKADVSGISIQVIDAANEKQGEKKYNVSFDLLNTGEAVDWDKVEVRFFYMNPPRKEVTVSNLSASSPDINVMSSSCTSKPLPGDFKTASNYFSFTFNSGDKFYTYEQVGVSFDINIGKDDDKDDIPGDERGFDVSHSLKGKEYICVYYDGKLLPGYIEPSDIYESKEFDVQIVGNENAFYSDNGASYTANFSLQNIGGDARWEDVEIRYYYMKPSNQQVLVQNITGFVDGYNEELSVSNTTLNPAKDGATNYISITGKNGSDMIFAGDNLKISLTMKYASGKNMTNEDSNYGFQNSYSLKGVNNIVVYYKGKVIWGSEPVNDVPKEDAVIEDSNINIVVDQFSTGVSWSSFNAYIKLKNLGEDYINMKYLQVRYYYYVTGTTMSSPTNSKQSPNVPSTLVKLAESSSSAVGYFDTNWRVNEYIGKDGTYEFNLYSSSENNANLFTCGIESSHSWINGVAVYYKGKLVYGSEPSGIQYDSSVEQFPEYPEVILPEITNVRLDEFKSYDVTWNGEGNNGAGYEYKFGVTIENWGDIDWSKLSIHLHQYYNTTEKTFNVIKLITWNMPSNDYVLSYGKSDKGDDQYYISFSNLPCQKEMYFNFYSTAIDIYGADKTMCYTQSADTIEIYYGDQLVWPKSN